MIDAEFELDLQPHTKANVQEQRKLKEEQEAQIQEKIKALQSKMEKSSLPQSSLKLRPTKQNTQEQQRLLNRETLLQLSRNLRHTHETNPFALSFKIKGPVFDEELIQKMRAALHNTRVRYLSTKRYFEHKQADSKIEQQHHRRYTFEM